jgi:hypothetical protein
MSPATRLRLVGGLVITVTAALALRLFFVLTPHAVLDADEAIVGLMGRHVLRGEFPIFYYGQRYMGSLEPHLTALGFALGGATPLVLKLVAFAVALVLVWLTAELGRRILGPGPGVVAGFFMALPPIFVTVWSLKARGGFVETLVLGTLVLLLAHRTVEAAGRHRLRAALVLGLVGGLGWWTCQLVVSYLAAAGLLVIRGAGWMAGLRVLPLVTGAFVLGSLPMWLQGWLGQPGAKSMWALVDPGTAASQLGAVFTIGLPALLGPGGRWPAPPVIEALTLPLLGIYGLAWVVLLGTRIRAWRGGPEASPATGAALDAILALPVVAVLVCALSPIGWFVSEPRYLLPLAAVVPILVAALLAMLARAGRRGIAAGLGLAVLVVNLAGHGLAPWTSAREAPYSLEAALTFFEARRIPVVATTYWIGPRLAFESAERVVAVPILDAPDRYPPYVALARRTDRLAYALLEGTTDVGATEQRLQAFGVLHDRTSLGELLIFHDLRLPGLDPAPPGLFFETLERLPALEARLRIAAAYEAAGQTDRAIRYLETALEPGMPAGSVAVDRLVPLYRATGQLAKARTLAARRAQVFTPAEPREVDFGDAVRLLGYTLNRPTLRAGERLTLVCFWSTRRALDVDLDLEIQLTDGMRRHPGSLGPVTSAYGAASWRPNEVVRGAHEIAIPRDLTPGRYMLRISLWTSRESEPGPRPRVEGHRDGSRWLPLTEIEVQHPG